MGHEKSAGQSKYEKYIDGVKKSSGIYAITIDDLVVYVGKAKNMRRRVRGHIRHALNGHSRDKYRLLLAAIEKHHVVRCIILEECAIKDLDEKERYFINGNCLPLNTQLSGSSLLPRNILNENLEEILAKCKTWSSELHIFVDKD